MKKNPFSFYDFMGYLFPGLIVLYILYYLHLCQWDFYQAINVNILIKTINQIGDKYN